MAYEVAIIGIFMGAAFFFVSLGQIIKDGDSNGDSHFKIISIFCFIIALYFVYISIGAGIHIIDAEQAGGLNVTTSQFLINNLTSGLSLMKVVMIVLFSFLAIVFIVWLILMIPDMVNNLKENSRISKSKRRGKGL